VKRLAVIAAALAATAAVIWWITRDREADAAG